MHRRIFALAVVLGLLIAAGCGKGKPIPAPDPEPTPAPVVKPGPEPLKDPTPIPTEAQPAYTVTAVGITQEFATNFKAAEKKYKDKLIAVEGTVASATQSSLKGTGEVRLLGYKTKPDDPLPLVVICQVKKALAGKVGLLGKGQKIRLTGRVWDAAAGNVDLKDGEYDPEATPSLIPKVTAEALAKEFAADQDAARKKYLDKDLIVQGVVSDLIEKNGQFSAKLTGDGKVRISCTLEEDEFKILKKGDKVRIKGEASIFDTGELVVTTAFLVDKQ